MCECFLYVYSCEKLSPTAAVWCNVCARVHGFIWGWLELYVYTVYDRILRNPPAKNIVYTPYMYGSGQLSYSKKQAVTHSNHGTKKERLQAVPKAFPISYSLA